MYAIAILNRYPKATQTIPKKNSTTRNPNME